MELFSNPIFWWLVGCLWLAAVAILWAIMADKKQRAVEQLVKDRQDYLERLKQDLQDGNASVP